MLYFPLEIIDYDILIYTGQDGLGGGHAEICRLYVQDETKIYL